MDIKKRIQELSLDQKAKLYYMGLVRQGKIDTLPEDPKAAYIKDMMGKVDTSAAGLEPADSLDPNASDDRDNFPNPEDLEEIGMFHDPLGYEPEDSADSKEDKLKMAYAAYDKAEMNGDIRGQELALAVIDLLKSGELKEMDSKIDALRTRRAQATIDDLNQYLQDNIGADDLVDSLQDMIKFLNQFIFENKTNNFDLKNFLVENKLTINSRVLNEDLSKRPEKDAQFQNNFGDEFNRVARFFDANKYKVVYAPSGNKANSMAAEHKSNEVYMWPGEMDYFFVAYPMTVKGKQYPDNKNIFDDKLKSEFNKGNTEVEFGNTDQGQVRYVLFRDKNFDAKKAQIN